MQTIQQITQQIIKTLQDDQQTPHLLQTKLHELSTIIHQVNDKASNHPGAKQLRIQTNNHLTTLITTLEDPTTLTQQDYDLPPHTEQAAHLQQIALTLAKQHKILTTAIITHTTHDNTQIELAINILLTPTPIVYRAHIHNNQIQPPTPIQDPTYTPPTATLYHQYLQAWNNQRSALIN